MGEGAGHPRAGGDPMVGTPPDLVAAGPLDLLVLVFVLGIGHADYAASKGAMISMVKGLALELAAHQININAVAPGWIDTEMTALPYAGDGRRKIEANIPVGRVASADDIAGPIVFLCSDLARHITGEIMNINGGSVLCG